ncbi:biotin/lipoyl-containing protein [Pectinatus brassicae]|uniref:Biotin carboxyl carrier protein n=1 Tax=Pectinatus brassicae TaxID=862415 RepID=A0A840UJK9_9FIRM|nr:biotin/lipoyl-containing protein [Pectinatus brassicae]MBB5336370.1 biotin carboxyl carrier protein [Pectinatus brassicae]
MRKNIYWIVLLCMMMVIGIYQQASAQSVINEKTILSGKVSWTIQPGIMVKQGSALVNIATLTGEITACRASADGIVQEVLVHPGDNIGNGQIVVKIIRE